MEPLTQLNYFTADYLTVAGGVKIFQDRLKIVPALLIKRMGGKVFF
jgi:hypothetical protein